LVALLLTGCDLGHLVAGAIIHPLRVPVVGEPSEPYQTLSIATDDGLVLDGWLFPVRGPRGLVVLVHGKDINRPHLAHEAGRFLRLGYAVLAFDQRAHGRSQGSVTTYGAKEVGDLQKALDVALGSPSLVSHPGLPIFLVGESLGAAVSLQTAAVEPRVRGVVAGASFADLRTVVEERSPWFVSAQLRAEALQAAAEEGGFRVDDLSPERAAASIKVPVLLLHGSDDTYIPMRHSLRISKALKAPQRLLVLEGVGHVDVLLHDAVWVEIERFIVGLTPTR
jgi:alpha-beta hydrolase superfamily lysophospholipase